MCLFRLWSVCDFEGRQCLFREFPQTGFFPQSFMSGGAFLGVSEARCDDRHGPAEGPRVSVNAWIEACTMGDDKVRTSQSGDPVLLAVIEQTSRAHIGEPLVGLTPLTRQNCGRDGMPSPARGACAPVDGSSEQRQQRDRRYVAPLRSGTPESSTTMPARCSGTAAKTFHTDNGRSGTDEQPAPDRIDPPPNLCNRQAPLLPAPDKRHNGDIQVAAIGGTYGADRYHDDIPRSPTPCGARCGKVSKSDASGWKSRRAYGYDAVTVVSFSYTGG
jgi:hypothetical protein